MTLPLQNNLHNRKPYKTPQINITIQLNTNKYSYELPEPVTLTIIKTITHHIHNLNHYPNQKFTTLRKTLAQYLNHNLNTNQI